MRASGLIRQYLGATIALALFAGVAGGMAIGLWGIARRTSTSLERFTAYEDAAAVTLFGCPDGVPPSPDVRTICAKFDYQDVLQFLHGLPAVRTAGRYSVVVAGVARADQPDAWTRQLVPVAIDPEAGALIGRPIIVAGRRADPNDPAEVVVNEAEQHLLRLQLGDRLVVTPWRFDEFAAAGEGKAQPGGMQTTVTVVGVVRHPSDLAARLGGGSIYSESAGLETGPAWWAQIDGDAARYGVGVGVQLVPGASVADVQDAFTARWPNRVMGFETGTFSGRTATEAIALEARSFQLIALFVAFASLVFVGQAVARQTRREWSDSQLLSAIGMTRGTMVWSQTLRSMVIAFGATATALVVAIGVSPLGPIGIGRAAEPDPGLRVDRLILALGLPLVALVVLSAAVLPVAKLRRRTATTASHTPRRLAGVLPTIGVAGLAMTGARRAGGVAMASAIAGVAVASAIGVAAWSLTASYQDLRAAPARYGATWDVSVGNDADAEQAASTHERLAAIPGIRVAGIESANDGPAGAAFTLTTFIPSIGDPSPPVVTRGRPPVGPTEVTLGRTTMHDLGVQLGDSVHLPPGDPSQGADLTVVGEAVINDGLGSLPGSGAFVAPEAFARLSLQSVAQSYAVWIDPDADRFATMAALRAAFPTTFVLPQPPDQIGNLGLVQRQPLLLALIVGAIAAAALVHALVLSVRRGRHQIGVLKALGFTRGQVSGSVAWHATLLVVPGVFIGVPLGIVIGRFVWTTIVDNIGIVSGPVLPIPVMATIAVLVLALANLAALWPGWSAARTQAAVALRME